MLSVSVSFSGNPIQEDIQVNMSKMLDVTLWLSQSEADLLARETHADGLLCKNIQQKLNQKPRYVK